MQVKRYRIDYDHWKCITEKNFIQKRLDDDQYHGYLGIIEIIKVRVFLNSRIHNQVRY